MPDVSIAGTKLPNVDTVTVNISLSGGEATRLPDCSASFTYPTDEDTILTDWILAPQGPDRFKKVEITTYDRSKKVNKTWTFAKAYIAHHDEGEFSGAGANMTTTTIVGTLIHAKADYDGTNILDVTAGDAEADPS
jgi:hypothetical protein